MKSLRSIAVPALEHRSVTAGRRERSGYVKIDSTARSVAALFSDAKEGACFWSVVLRRAADRIERGRNLRKGMPADVRGLTNGEEYLPPRFKDPSFQRR